MQKAIFASRVFWAGVLLLLPIWASAGGLTNATVAGDIQKGGGYEYQVPGKTNDGWDVADLKSVGLDADRISEFFKQLNAGVCTNMHSVLLVRSNKLVVEEYFSGPDWNGKQRTFNRDTLHTLQSATKSVNSILIGIAIDQHLISGVDEKISTFFPEFTGKDDLRLKHFLAMTAGLAWNENAIPYADPANDCIRMNNSSDPVGYVLGQPSIDAPGTKFVYNSGISIALGEIVRKVSGLSVDKFADRNLFQPLGITNFTWWAFTNGVVHTGGGLYMRPRDMAKIGCMMLNRGRWQGKQVVSEWWVNESIKKQAPDPGPVEGYGYQWWHFSFKVPGRDHRITAIQARGHGNQTILIFSSLDLVAVVTAWDLGNAVPFIKLMSQNILPAAL